MTPAAVYIAGGRVFSSLENFLMVSGGLLAAPDTKYFGATTPAALCATGGRGVISGGSGELFSPGSGSGSSRISSSVEPEISSSTEGRTEAGGASAATSASWPGSSGGT